MKKLLLAGAILAALYFRSSQTGDPWKFTNRPVDQPRVKSARSGKPDNVFTEQKSGSRMTGVGTVTKVLPDDNDGSRHQRFILTLASGQTLLIAHNIDLAPRVDSLKSGDTIAFSGVYESNDLGGVVHWTHRDPSGRHLAGWLKHAGKIYQ